MDGLIKYYRTREEAERAAILYRQKAKVKTDVFRVKCCEQGFYVEQDLR